VRHGAQTSQGLLLLLLLQTICAAAGSSISSCAVPKCLELLVLHHG
jgi:hypothetical protein